MNLTYEALKKQIIRKSYTSKDDVLQKMDIFLIGDRISQKQYDELKTLLSSEV